MKKVIIEKDGKVIIKKAYAHLSSIVLNNKIRTPPLWLFIVLMLLVVLV